MNMYHRILIVVAALLLVSHLSATEQKKEWKDGTVLVEFVVGKDGRPTKIKVIEASDKQLATSVIDAVSKWQLDKKYAGKKIRQPVEFQNDPPKEKKG